MGFLRLLSVKSTNYVEHASEYGIHWNFLFTVAAVKVIQIIIENLIIKINFAFFHFNIEC